MDNKKQNLFIISVPVKSYIDLKIRTTLTLEELKLLIDKHKGDIKDVIHDHADVIYDYDVEYEEYNPEKPLFVFSENEKILYTTAVDKLENKEINKEEKPKRKSSKK